MLNGKGPTLRCLSPLSVMGQGELWPHTPEEDGGVLGKRVSTPGRKAGKKDYPRRNLGEDA